MKYSLSWDEERSLLAGSIGAMAAVAAAGLLVGVRDIIAGANVALILAVVVVVAAAIGGRVAGAVTAAPAAVCFAFFHTRPYGSLKIANADDVLTTILLVAIGLVAGQLSHRLRSTRRRRSPLTELHRLQRVAARASLGDSAEDLTLQVTAELIDALSLRECWYESTPFIGALPTIESDGSLSSRTYRWAAGGFELPRDGAAVLVRVGGRHVGRFVLSPTPGVPIPVERRLIALALADQVGVVMALRAA